MSKKHERFAQRLSHILHKLNDGLRLDTHQLAEEFDTTTRTIQRDLNERLDFLNWNEQGPRYYSIDKTKLGHLNTEDIARFARFCSIQDLLPQIDRRFYQEQLIQSVQVKGVEYEDIKAHVHEFDQIQAAIDGRHPIEFSYTKAANTDGPGKYYRLEPYALINRLGIWYVIGIDIEAGKQKTFYFKRIRALNVQSESVFEHNPALLQAIRDNDSLSHGNQLAEVVIQVAPYAAPYFTRRALLPNQQQIRKLEDGGLLLACKNVNEMDVIPVVQYWIPHLRIISPENLQDKITERLQQYLGSH